MLWKRLSDSVDEVYRQWLASITACCASFPGSQEAPSQEVHDWNVGEKTIEVCYEQPRTVAPINSEPPQHQRPTSGSSTVMTSKWRMRSRSLASRASSQGSLLMRRNLAGRPRRPTIGSPSDFRRVPKDHGQHPDEFRPLELSIYLPQNRLPPLPDFSSPVEEPANQGVLDQHFSFPQVTAKKSHQSSNFRITRKPLGSADLHWCTRPHRSFDTLTASPLVNSDWSVPPLQPRPDSFTSSGSHVHQQPPRPPPTVRSYSSRGPLRQLDRRDSDASHLSRGRSSQHDMFTFGDVRSAARSDEVRRARGSCDLFSEYSLDDHGDLFSSDQSVVARPHPLKSHSSLPALSEPAIVRLQASPARSSTPMQINPSVRKVTPSRAQVSTCVFPVPSTMEVQSIGDSDMATLSSATTVVATTLATHTDRTRSSTVSSLCTRTTFEDPPSPRTVTPQSSPGRPTPIRQRTFGYGESVTTLKASGSAPAIRPIDELTLDASQRPEWATVVDGKRQNEMSMTGSNPFYNTLTSLSRSSSSSTSPRKIVAVTYPTPPSPVGMAF